MLLSLLLSRVLVFLFFIFLLCRFLHFLSFFLLFPFDILRELALFIAQVSTTDTTSRYCMALKRETGDMGRDGLGKHGWHRT